MLNKFEIFLSLFSAVTVTIVCILQKTPLFEAAYRLVFSILAFYFIGLIVKFYLQKNVFYEKKEEPINDDQPVETIDNEEESFLLNDDSFSS